MDMDIGENLISRSEESPVDVKKEPELDLFNPRVNPLMIPSILELVLTFLPIPDLNASRSVCSTWNHEINRFFVQKVKRIEILDDNFEQAEKLLEENFQDKLIYLAGIKCDDSSCSTPVFEKLSLYLGTNLHELVLSKCQVDVNSFLSMMLVNAFPNLSILKLQKTTYRDPQGRQTIFIQNEEHEPVLSSLKKLEIYEVGPNSQTTLNNIAIMCPNLNWLTYGNCPPPKSDFRRRFPKVKLPFLEHLQLAPLDGKKMTFQYFDALIHLKMRKLKTIVFYGMDPGGEKRIKRLHNFLKSVSKTLEALHLGQRIMYNPEYQSTSPSPFPASMRNLKKLSVGPGFVKSMKFFDKMPNINTFTCSRTRSHDWTTVIEKGIPTKPHEAMRCLDLGDISHLPLQKLGPCFPNVTKLELNLSRIENHDEVVRAVFGGFSKLQTFSIYDLSNQNKLTDAGITGISKADCIKMLKKKSLNASKIKREHPYVGNLKQLIDLRLQYLSGQLTDASVVFGIKDISTLFALDLSNSQITDLSLRCIAEHIPSLAVLYINNCPNITSQGILAFQQQLGFLYVLDYNDGANIGKQSEVLTNQILYYHSASKWFEVFELEPLPALPTLPSPSLPTSYKHNVFTSVFLRLKLGAV